ncbi:MAG TPA: DUF5684 domain-containing protein [Fimbriimonadaceae bacterium]|nr:DUF5684 domain-containing protein [Fimbriimonadaceae bacterium]
MIELAQADGAGIVALLLKFTGLVLGSLCGTYLYTGIVLHLLANKTKTPGAGLAWVPIGNLFLMCSIARRSPATVVLLLIPIVNLVAGAVLWMSIAENRGKPAWTGALVFIPILGLLVPFYLISGPPADPVGTPSAAPPVLCPNCRTPGRPGEAFCGECGVALPSTAPVPVSVRRTPALQLAAVGAVLVAVFVGGSSAAVWGWMGSALAYNPPKRTAPALPGRMAGTMKEFPVDSAPTSPAKPDAVVAETYLADGASSKVPEKWLPKGVDRSSMPKRAKSLTSATYRKKKTDEPVVVTAIEPRDPGGDLPGTLADDITKAGGGTKTGIQVDSPTGATYTGIRIEQPTTQIYILTRGDTGTVIIVLATDPSTFGTADRLAENLGNGLGLAEPDTEENPNPLFLLPTTLPAGLELVDLQSLTAEEVLAQAEWQKAEAEASSDAQARKALAAVRQLLPERWTIAEYADGSGKQWRAGVLDYADVRRTWFFMYFLKSLLTAAEMRTVTVRGVEGWLIQDGSASSLVFQKGPYIAIVDAPDGTPAERLIAFGDVIQL